MNEKQKEIAAKLLDEIAAPDPANQRISKIREYAEFVTACRTHAEAEAVSPTSHM